MSQGIEKNGFSQNLKLNYDGMLLHKRLMGFIRNIMRKKTR